MALLVAESVLEFGSSLREAMEDAAEWARARGWHRLPGIARQRQEGLRLPRCLPRGLTLESSGKNPRSGYLPA
jgi:hypothetical protein